MRAVNNQGRARRVEFGDWQTPPELAARVFDVLQNRGVNPLSVVEPTCGRGAFVVAAATACPDAHILGFELSESHLAAARSALTGTQVVLQQADFFDLDWKAVLAGLADPVLIVGNPPWVTSATLGSLASENLPEKANFKQHRGLDAKTGKANFDISEWMILHLLSVLQGREFTLAMLCKSSVARRVLEVAHEQGWRVDGATYRIDAKAHFGAAVDAVLMLVTSARTAECAYRWGVYDHLGAAAPAWHTGMVGGTICSDLEAFARTRGLSGRSEIEWRSGVKHDCASVMELHRDGDGLLNGLGETVDVEQNYLYPMRKGSDVANGRAATDRYVLVTQRSLGEDTTPIRERAPKTWAYLAAHAALLRARKSSVYLGQPPYAMFGIGDYSFAPFKVAVCGLYKHLNFNVLGPVEGRPVMLDDTSYFLPCRDAEQAELLSRVLNGKHAQEFLRARIFWDAKRPVNKALLQSLSLDALLRAEGVARGLGVFAAVKQLGLAGIGS
jgi:methylase of polypeptide subunit release factors